MRRRSLGDTNLSNCTNLQIAGWLTTTILVCRSQVLPEQAVIQVAASVEVEEGCKGGSLREVALGLGITNALESRVQSGNIGLVVLRVVELHNLAGDVRLECAVVVWFESWRLTLAIVTCRGVDGWTRRILTRKIRKCGLAADKLSTRQAHGRLCDTSSKSSPEAEGSRS